MGIWYPFELPLGDTAFCACQCLFYVNSVHLSFLILNKQQSKTQHVELYNQIETTSYENHTFLATVHHVYAIGAAHANLVDADGARDPRDRMLYFANARVLVCTVEV